MGKQKVHSYSMVGVHFLLPHTVHFYQDPCKDSHLFVLNYQIMGCILSNLVWAYFGKQIPILGKKVPFYGMCIGRSD